MTAVDVRVEYRPLDGRRPMSSLPRSGSPRKRSPTRSAWRPGNMQQRATGRRRPSGAREADVSISCGPPPDSRDDGHDRVAVIDDHPVFRDGTARSWARRGSPSSVSGTVDEARVILDSSPPPDVMSDSARRRQRAAAAWRGISTLRGRDLHRLRLSPVHAGGLGRGGGRVRRQERDDGRVDRGCPARGRRRSLPSDVRSGRPDLPSPRGTSR